MNDSTPPKQAVKERLEQIRNLSHKIPVKTGAYLSMDDYVFLTSQLEAHMEKLSVAREALQETEGIILKFQNAHDDNAYLMAEKAGNRIDEALKKIGSL